MTNLAKRSSDYNWRGAEIELLASHYSAPYAPLATGVAAVEQNGVVVSKAPQTWDEIVAGAPSGLRLLSPEAPANKK